MCSFTLMMLELKLALNCLGGGVLLLMGLFNIWTNKCIMPLWLLILIVVTDIDAIVNTRIFDIPHLCKNIIPFDVGMIIFYSNLLICYCCFPYFPN